MTSDNSSAYDPKEVESKWYQFWQDNHLFQANLSSDKPAYSIILPPPNVTGVLHMGHALDASLQDALCRYKRLKGFEVLWQPGLDHAGISTQTVVEKHLMKTEGKRRRDYSREEFLKHVWNWKELHQDRIVQQQKKLGSSLDWDRLRFTLDDDAVLAVQTVFKNMYDDGLIYRGDYLVNWDPITQTALADDEVEYEDQDGFIWHFKYPIADSSEYVEIATTRPETMLGDLAVAVCPDDPRYQHLHSKKVIIPIVDRIVPIIQDDYVDPEFGTGVVKITPAHDFNDYEIGQRHNLGLFNIMTEEGCIDTAFPEFEGMSMLEARDAIIQKMSELNLFVKKVPHQNRIGVSYRSKAIVQPFLSKQWFVNMQPFKKPLRDYIENGLIDMIPDSHKKTYYHWIDNLKDWCISRQLWWGHQIPIWYHKDEPNKMICHVGKDLPKEVQQAPDDWIRDEDVLDTWFSSAMWPFSSLGWPNNKKLTDRFYPTSVLVTGHDILFFWVARMILMGHYVQKEKPFSVAYIHGLIYGKSYWRIDDDGSSVYIDHEERERYELGEKPPKGVFSKWEKMSKSKGNVINPLEMIDKYGTDAVRMTLIASTTKSPQLDLDRRRFEEYKNFSNKLWNAARFVFMNTIECDSDSLSASTLSKGLSDSDMMLEDRWILSRLSRVINQVDHYFDIYHFDKIASTIYHFFWDEFCAAYIEMCKPYLFKKLGSNKEREHKQKMLIYVFSACMVMMHPIAPFITEEIFSKLAPCYCDIISSDRYSLFLESLFSKRSIMQASFPQAFHEDMNDQSEHEFGNFYAFVTAIRNIRAETGIATKEALNVIAIGESSLVSDSIHSQKELLLEFLSLSSLTLSKDKPKGFYASASLSNCTLYVELPKELIEKELSRLTKEKEKLENLKVALENKLSNNAFIERAPKDVVEKTRKELSQCDSRIDEITKKLI